MKRLTHIFLAILFGLLPAEGLKASSEGVYLASWEGRALTDNGVAILGFDPVSYHQTRGPRQGKEYIRAVYRGATYHFSSHSNRTRFVANPEKYEPACGGWCALGVSRGECMTPNPHSYKMINGKTHLFYKTHRINAKEVWERKAHLVSEEKLLHEMSRQWIKLQR